MPPCALQGYELLDSTLGTVFVHVTYRDSFTQGRLFSSDLTAGQFYSSLANQTTSIALGTPWVEVPTVYGTYFTSKSSVAEGADLASTLVTLDMGASWHPLPPVSEACAAQPDCALQLYFSTDIETGSVASEVGAVGLVLGSGHEGSVIDVRAPDPKLYGSWDGGEERREGLVCSPLLPLLTDGAPKKNTGRSWSALLDGVHAFVIGDGGGVVLAVDLRPLQTRQLLLSLDWGAQWTPCDFFAAPVALSGLTTASSHREPTFLLYGQINTSASLVVQVDATALYVRECVGANAPGTVLSDFELWSPNATACTLGAHITYLRRKQNVQCRYSADLSSFVFSIVACPCTEADFACSSCFSAAGTTCVQNAGCAAPVPSPCIGSYQVPSGYRKLTGNRCSGGLEAALLTPGSDTARFCRCACCFLLLVAAHLPERCRPSRDRFPRARLECVQAATRPHVILF
jgi:hypothetical protein